MLSMSNHYRILYNGQNLKGTWFYGCVSFKGKHIFRNISQTHNRKWGRLRPSLDKKEIS